jgi:hypothetical protein
MKLGGLGLGNERPREQETSLACGLWQFLALQIVEYHVLRVFLRETKIYSRPNYLTQGPLSRTIKSWNLSCSLSPIGLA